MGESHENSSAAHCQKGGKGKEAESRILSATFATVRTLHGARRERDSYERIFLLFFFLVFVAPVLGLLGFEESSFQSFRSSLPCFLFSLTLSEARDFLRETSSGFHTVDVFSPFPLFLVFKCICCCW